MISVPLHSEVSTEFKFVEFYHGKLHGARGLLLPLEEEVPAIQLDSYATAPWPAEHFTNASTKDNLHGNRYACMLTSKIGLVFN